ncbi:copper radical oxidase [Gymnopilus junonius]|uniref:Copper radical oxidase n=1 Tax=Gymnopilus junonius TaxID=109634 RepID=A0A9P5NMN3_GYMJU|nr:copper radical oxidase [Gymnopilus junonius]
MARKRHLFLTTWIPPLILAQHASIIPPPGQPGRSVTPGTFELIEDTFVSAQQIFLGRPDKVYIIDKVENNLVQMNDHPAWAAEYRVSNESQRPMDILTNTFCAGGNVLGNGTWINVGGNQAVTTGGEPAIAQDGSIGPYHDADGRKSIRLLTPCDNSNCQWKKSPFESEQRWYPTVETLEDGRAIILGGCRNGGYLNDITQSNPTYEFFPPSNPPRNATPSPILQSTLPANLYPLTWLLPSGRLFIQSGWKSVLLDYRKNVETQLDDVPDAVRAYPASAGNVMLPLTPANNWTATILFCGGVNVTNEAWTTPDFVPVALHASTSCVKITPDLSRAYLHDDPLPQGRIMASLILLPDGKVLCINGAMRGTAGYGPQPWAIGKSYADEPLLMPTIYDPTAPLKSRWSSHGLSPSTVPRMYHSTATLLPDGSVFISGSNPNPDFASSEDRRPQPVGLISKLSYGGPSFDVMLDADDLFENVANAENATVVLMRTGFSTHAIVKYGPAHLTLHSTYTGFTNNTAVLHVSQLPPNPAVFAPGPAFLFVVVRGIPSIGVQVMVGSGKIEEQKASAIMRAMQGEDGTVLRKLTSGSGSAHGRMETKMKYEWIGDWVVVCAVALSIILWIQYYPTFFI